MAGLSDDLLRRIRERAADPKRRYMTAAEDEAMVSLPVEEIEQRMDASELADGDMFRAMLARLKANGFPAPTMSFGEFDGHIRSTTESPGARPLKPPPSGEDWQNLERIAGRPMPQDLRSLYSIANGGFGPGFTGLNDLFTIGAHCEDFRRRGPDYCGTIAYPDCFIPIASETLDYHYDLDTGRIISSNQDWHNDGLEPEDIYDIAFQDLAAMIEDWLQRG